MKLFVDDYREIPDSFWHLAKTITEAVRILSGPVYAEVVSLDHDIIYREGKHSFSEETFATVARYIAIMPKDRLPKIVYIHTANPKGARDIEEILKGIVTTEIIEGSYDLSRNDYKEQLIKLEQEREQRKEEHRWEGEF
jgi:hypothetical protein